MDEEYDVIILGTGLKECVLSGILSKEGKKVLHMDRKDYYGGASASLTPLERAFEHFKKDGKPDEKKLGRGRDYNIDLIPKFLMASGKLVHALFYSGVTRYLEFKQLEGSYVYKTGGKVWKVPSTPTEAMTSSLMGMFQKNYFRKFLRDVYNFKADDKSTWVAGKLSPQMKMAEVYKAYGLDDNSQDFIGHALALHRDDSYKGRAAMETIPKIQLYGDSIQRYGSSPYLYPLYGLGELPQGFARLSAIYGGTYMLARPIDSCVYGDDGRVVAVKASDPDHPEGAIADVKCKMVIADPSYFPDKCKTIGRVIRSICILDHPLPKTKGSKSPDNPDGGALSAQIIIPANQIDAKFGAKKHDIYIGCVSHAHNVAPKGMYLAFISTTVETENPEAEIACGLERCGPILERFTEVSDIVEPLEDGSKDGIYISTAYDATSHFETTFEDINSLYKRVTGADLDLTKVQTDGEGGEDGAAAAAAAP